MFKYICEDCFAVTSEDVWTCSTCGEETKIHQVEIVPAEIRRVQFHKDVSFALSRKLIKYALPDIAISALNVDYRINSDGRIVYTIK